MEFQLITATDHTPFRLSVTKAVVSDSHFDSHLKIFLVLRGSISCTLAGTSYIVTARDFIFTNPYEIYAIQQVVPDTNLLVLEVDTQLLRQLFPSEEHLFFRWKETFNNRNSFLYREVTETLTILTKEALNKEPAHLARATQQIIRLLIALFDHCKAPAPEHRKSNSMVYQTQKAAEMMEYLNDHYAEPVSLQTMAEAVHLSAPYVSRLFKDTFGIGFLEYVNQLRIKKSLPMLTNTGDYILDIALSVGFNNTKTYGRLFTQLMGETPTEYRNRTAVPSAPTKHLTESGSEKLSPLLSFLADTKISDNRENAAPISTIAIQQDGINCISKPFPRKWNKTLSVGMAALLLRKYVQEQILKTVSDMNYEYVRITGVLSDNLQIYQEDSFGNVTYFWVLLDGVLDFLVSNHLKPFLCLGFMPEKLASRLVPSPYHWNANTSKPKSLTAWCTYLRTVLQHLVIRYSYEEVCTWKFEFWNSPDLKGLFWHDSKEDFFEFFLASYQTFREVLPDGLFGSPGMVKFNNFAFTREFLQFCREKHVRLDFINLHIFMITDPTQTHGNLQQILSLGPDQDVNGTQFLNHAVKQLDAILSETHMRAPICISEWNVSPYHHDLSRDTCFMAPYICDTINHLPAQVDEISFWALTDYMEEHTPHQELFTGELGMKTQNGLPKPSYLAFILLYRMKEDLIASGDGYFMTQSEGSYQILLYNFAYYNEDFLNGTTHKLAELDRYQIYEHGDEKLFQIHLKLPSGTYRIERHCLNREYGSIYDHWVKMGTPAHLDMASYYCLDKKSFPEINIRHQTIEEHMLLSESVPVHGVELIIITKI